MAVVNISLADHENLAKVLGDPTAWGCTVTNNQVTHWVCPVCSASVPNMDPLPDALPAREHHAKYHIELARALQQITKQITTTVRRP